MIALTLDVSEFNLFALVRRSDKRIQFDVSQFATVVPSPNFIHASRNTINSAEKGKSSMMIDRTVRGVADQTAVSVVALDFVAPSTIR